LLLTQCLSISKLLGIFIDSDIYIQVMMNLIMDEESKSNAAR